MRRARCVVTLALALVAARAGAQEREEPREDIEAREAYFWAQRSYPFSARPYGEMMRARIEAANRISPFRSITGAGAATSWRPLGPAGFFMADNGFFSSGPQLDAGRVTAVAPGPTGGPLVIGTASGGVWRSTFGLWSPLTDANCALTIGAVAIDPVEPEYMYAGTGEYNANSVGCGVLRTTNGGQSWESVSSSAFQLSSGGAASFARILVDRPIGTAVGASVLLGATNIGVFRSTDGGLTWASVLSGATASIVQHPANPAVFFAGNSDNAVASRRGLYRSGTRGATWTPVSLPPSVDVSSIGRIELAVSAASPDRIYALIADRSTRRLLGLFAYNDATSQWTKLAAAGVYTGNGRGDFGAQSEYNLAIAADPRDANRIYVAGIRAFRSTDGGASFTTMAMEVHCDWHVITVDPRNPDILYGGTDGGVFVSSDAGDSWTSRNAGLAITQYYPGIAVAPDGSKMMGGSQDNGTHVYFGNPVWNGFTGGDGGYTIINYANPSIIYGEAQWSSSGAYIIRRDATGSQFRTTGIIASDRGAFIPPLIMDPVTPTTLYFATHRLYRSVNEGELWTPISADLTRGSGRIMTVAIAKSDARTIYVGTSDGVVQVSRDNGVTFAMVTNGLPVRAITRVVVDPADAAHAIVTVSGFGTGHVFETTNAGTAWVDISAGLSNAPANSGAFVPGVGIMVGTDVGVFQRATGATTWQSGPVGLPNVIVQDLVYAPGANLVVAGTYGRGMFAFTVGADATVLRGDVNADGKVDAFDALFIQQAIVGSIPSTIPAYPRGDANCNGSIEAGDVMLVLRAAVGLPTAGSCVNTVR